MSDATHKPSDDDTCGTCRFMRQGPSYSRCCRYPPITNPHQPDGATGFPIVRTDDYCGEFQRGPGGP
jgi:hypothetical protein